MRHPIQSEYPLTADSNLLFKPLTQSDLNGLLLRFYLALDFESRRKRFGGGVSDDTIRRHCRRLNLDCAIILACLDPTDLLAVVELHPIMSSWNNVELAIVDCAKTNRTTIVAHLLQLAAFAAGKRGCSNFIIPCLLPEREYLELLAGMGSLHIEMDTARVDVSEYAKLLHQTDLRM